MLNVAAIILLAANYGPILSLSANILSGIDHSINIAAHWPTIKTNFPAWPGEKAKPVRIVIQKPMTAQEKENAYFDRFGIANQ